jgi:hypothetical protein
MCGATGLKRKKDLSKPCEVLPNSRTVLTNSRCLGGILIFCLYQEA